MKGGGTEFNLYLVVKLYGGGRFYQFKAGKHPMIELNEFKKSLGGEGYNLTEEEILKLRENQDKMAEVFFAMFMDQKNETSN